MSDRDNEIRERAYDIWQREGEPDGRAEEHWHRAKRELDGERGDDRDVQPGSDVQPNDDVQLDNNLEPDNDIVPAAPEPEIGRVPPSQPGGTFPGRQPGATMGSIGTSGSAAARASGNRRRAKG